MTTDLTYETLVNLKRELAVVQATLKHGIAEVRELSDFKESLLKEFVEIRTRFSALEQKHTALLARVDLSEKNAEFKVIPPEDFAKAVQEKNKAPKTPISETIIFEVEKNWERKKEPTSMRTLSHLFNRRAKSENLELRYILDDLVAEQKIGEITAYSGARIFFPYASYSEFHPDVIEQVKSAGLTDSQKRALSARRAIYIQSKIEDAKTPQLTEEELAVANADAAAAFGLTGEEKS